MREPMIVRLPFPGFYETALSGNIDRAEESEAEGMSGHDEEEHPGKSLNSQVFAQLLYDHANYRKMHEQLAAEYVVDFSQYVKDTADFDLQLRFKEMISPREYNFSTDVLLAFIPFEVVQTMFENVSHGAFANVIREECTSRSGFFSFYSNDLQEWLLKPLDQWDTVELGLLLRTYIESDLCLDLDELKERVVEDLNYDDAIDKGVDWQKLYDKREEKRNGKAL